VGGWGVFSLKKAPKTQEFKASFPLETVACLPHRQGHAVWSSDQLMSEERSLGSLIGVSAIKGLSNSCFFESGQIIEYIVHV